MRLTANKSLAASDLFAAGEAKNLAISAAEWLRARLRPPWSLRFCDAMCVPLITAGFLYRAGAETPLNFREKFRVFPRMILEISQGSQTAVLVSTAEVWISAPDTQTPIFLGVSGYPQLTLVFLPGDEKFRIFS